MMAGWKGEYTCPNCGRVLEEDFKLCPFCGAEVRRPCASCGKEIRTQWNICPFCRKPTHEVNHYIETAREQLNEGKYEEALNTVRLGKQLYPSNEDLYALEKTIEESIRKAQYDYYVAQGLSYEQQGHIYMAITLYEEATKTHKDEDLLQRIAQLRSRLEEENRLRIVNEAKRYEEAARAYEAKGKLSAALLFYKKAYETQHNTRIQKKIEAIEAERSKKKRRFLKLTIIFSGSMLLIAAALILALVLL